MEADDGFNNWDLEAVVRAACRLSPAAASSSAAAAEAPDPFSSFLPISPPSPRPSPTTPAAAADAAWLFPDFSVNGNGLEELDELSKAFFPTRNWRSPSPRPRPGGPQQQQQQSPATAAGGLHQQQQQQPRQPSRPAASVPRSKRRKNQQKKVVCHVPADGASADMWAWRKYGQKPIKGSPYPRGYYRCSSSKGCMARKQVERSRTDPNMFIITYTAEHNHPVPTHRNSLAGSTRQKFPAPLLPPPPLAPSSSAAAAAGGDGGNGQVVQRNVSASPPSTSTAAGLSPTTPLTASMDGDAEEDEEDEDEGMLLVEDMEMVGEDELLFVDPEGPSGCGNVGSGVAAMSALFDCEEMLFNPMAPPPPATATATATATAVAAAAAASGGS